MKMIMRCPISYEPVEPGQKYSLAGLKRLSHNLKQLHDLPWTAESQRLEAVERATKISIQGVQSKLSATLNVTQGKFDLVDKNGRFILKPQSSVYPQLPENEDVTMRLAALVGIETPLHGMIYSIDGSLTYFIKRFDRGSRGVKYGQEDFSQLTQDTRDTKYNSSMEKVAEILEKNCTFPILEKKKLLQRVIFNFLIGNEDMHLKNFSLISRDNKIELTPAYDLVNSTLALKNAKEEIALPLNGKKRNLRKKDFIEYYAYERLMLNSDVVDKISAQFSANFMIWENLINMSFLSDESKQGYLTLLRERVRILSL